VKFALGAALVLVLGAAPAYAGMPDNDILAKAHPLTAITSDGVRVNAFDVNLNADVVNEQIGMPSPINDSGDPPFVRPNSAAASNCFDDPADAPSSTRTVWYRIVPDLQHATFPERTVVAMDTVSTTYGAAIDVFEGSVPSAWSGTPAPPQLVACGQFISPNQPYVSFVAKPGLAYYAVIGSITGSGGTLTISMRASDVQAPALTVTADSLLPDLGDTTTFGISAVDKGTGVSAVTAEVWFPDGSGRRAALPYSGPCVDNTAPPSHYCTVGSGPDLSQVIVHWPRREGNGIVRVVATDGAGNSSPAEYTLHVRDRTPPTVYSASAQPYHGTGARVVGFCSEAGKMLVQITKGNGHSVRGQKTVPLLRRSAIRYRGVKHYHRVGHGFFTVKVTCQDQAQNKTSTYTFLFIP
jgi:hypothetical protein